MNQPKPDFRSSYRDFQELVREYFIIRKLNLKNAQNQPELLLFAEGGLILIILERFLRILPGIEARDGDTLFNLLERAVSRKILKLPNLKDFIHKITNIRNTLLHGNYEQACRDAGLETVAEYFKKQYCPEIETIYTITNSLVEQIDPATGLPI